MQRPVFAIVAATYLIGVFGRGITAAIGHWESGLPLDTLIAMSVGDGFRWPVDLVGFFI